MRSMSDTIARLNAASGLMTVGAFNQNASRLTPLTDFGSNPGALTGYAYLPAESADMPLVVVLHGCTQNAAGYDIGSGWSALAERFGFAVLYAEQARGNNANGCFNWFVPEDTRRDGGEALSIRQMIGAMVDRHAIDPARIYVTGLSAGGAMTSVMLSTYPEVFAGGAIIAGLPYGAATSVPQAFDRMRGHGHPTDAKYAAAIRTASPHPGPWPSVSVWQGDADHTVDVTNADHILGQWRALHGLAAKPDAQDIVDGVQHRVWNAPDGARIEEYRIPGMGHGTPLRTDGDTACGTPMAYMLAAGISSTWHIAQGWGLLKAERRTASVNVQPERKPAATPPVAVTAQPYGVQATIEAALRSAGLMR